MLTSCAARRTSPLLAVKRCVSLIAKAQGAWAPSFAVCARSACHLILTFVASWGLHTYAELRGMTG